MATLKNTGATLPSAGATVDVGNPDWTNPSNITIDNDTNYASCTLPASPTIGYTDFLRGYTYGFAIPSDAVIKGIEVTVRAKVVATVGKIYQISLRNGGTLLGAVKSPSTELTTSFANYTYGSNSDVWGSSSAALMAVINTANFGIYLAGVKNIAADKTIRIQYIKVTVYYVIPPTTTILAASLIADDTARMNAEVLNDGGAVCQGRFCWGKIETEDDFEWGSDGDSLDPDPHEGGIDWAISVAGTSKAEIDTAQHYAGTRSARLYRDGTNHARGYFAQSPLNSSQVISFPVRKDDTSEFRLYHGDGTKCIVVAYLATEDLKYYDTTWQDTGIDTTVGTWALLEIRNVDWNAGTYDIYQDGIVAKTGATMRTYASFSGQVSFYNMAGTSEVWLDNVRVLANRTTTDWDGGSYSTDDPFHSDLTSLIPGTKHVYEARLKNSAGDGVWSADITFHTLVSIELRSLTGTRADLVLAVVPLLACRSFTGTRASLEFDTLITLALRSASDTRAAIAFDTLIVLALASRTTTRAALALSLGITKLTYYTLDMRLPDRELTAAIADRNLTMKVKQNG